jgi:hypothetical protein
MSEKDDRPLIDHKMWRAIWEQRYREVVEALALDPTQVTHQELVDLLTSIRQQFI